MYVSVEVLRIWNEHNIWRFQNCWSFSIPSIHFICWIFSFCTFQIVRTKSVGVLNFNGIKLIVWFMLYGRNISFVTKWWREISHQRMTISLGRFKSLFSYDFIHRFIKIAKFAIFVRSFQGWRQISPTNANETAIFSCRGFNRVAYIFNAIEYVHFLCKTFIFFPLILFILFLGCRASLM